MCSVAYQYCMVCNYATTYCECKQPVSFSHCILWIPVSLGETRCQMRVVHLCLLLVLCLHSHWSIVLQGRFWSEKNREGNFKQRYGIWTDTCTAAGASAEKVQCRFAKTVEANYLQSIPSYEKENIFGANWLITEWNASTDDVCIEGDSILTSFLIQWPSRMFSSLAAGFEPVHIYHQKDVI